MTAKRFWPGLAAVAISAVVASCGGGGGSISPPAAAVSANGAGAGSPPAVSGSATDAGGSSASGNGSSAGCTLLSASDVTAAFGQPVTDVTEAAALCTFDSADHVKGLGVSTYPDRNAMALPLAFEPGGEHVSGLGDDAYWLPGGTLFVRKGDRGFTLTGLGLDPADPSATAALKTALIGLAKVVLAKF